MNQKLKPNFTFVPDAKIFPIYNISKYWRTPATPTITLSTTANVNESNETSTLPTIFSVVYTPPISLTTSVESIVSNLSSALSTTESIQLTTVTVNATNNTKVNYSVSLFWVSISCTNIIIFLVLLFVGVMYKRKVATHDVLDDTNIEFQVIQNYSADTTSDEFIENI